MINATKSTWQSSLTQSLRVGCMMAEHIKQLEAKGFRRVPGTPDVWEHRGMSSVDEVKETIESILGPDKVKGVWREKPEKVYRPGVGLQAILWDGWSRGFYPRQTLVEARAQGFVVSLEWIEAHWQAMTNEMLLFEAKLHAGQEV
jgi:hypothetical protein